MDADLVELKVAIGIMATKLEALTSNVVAQGEIIEELVALSNQGRGAAWVLIGMGGIAGAFLSNIKYFLSIFAR